MTSQGRITLSSGSWSTQVRSVTRPRTRTKAVGGRTQLVQLASATRNVSRGRRREIHQRHLTSTVPCGANSRQRGGARKNQQRCGEPRTEQNMRVQPNRWIHSNVAKRNSSGKLPTHIHRGDCIIRRNPCEIMLARPRPPGYTSIRAVLPLVECS